MSDDHDLLRTIRYFTGQPELCHPKLAESLFEAGQNGASRFIAKSISVLT